MVLSLISRLTEARSLSFALGKPGTLGSNSGSKAFLPEADIVASVRPWKPPSKVMISYAVLVHGAVFAREFDRAFVGFRAGIGEEHLVEATAIGQSLGELQ